MDQLKKGFPELSHKWDEDIIPQLEQYVRIPNKSPMFDPEWKTHGYMNQAMELIQTWCRKQKIRNMKIELIHAENRTPLLFIEILNTNSAEIQVNDTVLLYGHMDKQPEMSGWDTDLGPWIPVLKDEKLYGRGAGDDGYAVFCAITAIEMLQNNHIPHHRCIVLIEASEESGSPDLPHYLEILKEKIGTPTLIICLDSECGNYAQLWGTTSLRGLVGGTLKIEVLTQGIHSGAGSGVVPSVFNVLRQLLNRIEDPQNGKILLPEFHVEIPENRIKEAKEAALALGDNFYKDYPFSHNTQPISLDVSELILNRTWRPALSLVGINGAPPIANAGNVTLPNLELKLSVRTPPTCDSQKAGEALKKILESDPPHHATVQFNLDEASDGWQAPPSSNWLTQLNDQASMMFYGKKAAYLGCGGSIPFMNMLGKMFPQAQFLITGVLGPKSNAHGPNEFLHIPMVKRLTGVISAVIAGYYNKG